MSVNATEVTCSLHWLPIRQRIQFKIGLLGFKARHCIAASVSAIYCLQPSSDQAVEWVDIKPAVNSNFSSRAFSVSVPTVWNSLKPNLRFVYSSASFRSQPKTTPFHSAYGNSLYSLAWLRACIQPFWFDILINVSALQIFLYVCMYTRSDRGTIGSDNHHQSFIRGAIFHWKVCWLSTKTRQMGRRTRDWSGFVVESWWKTHDMFWIHAMDKQDSNRMKVSASPHRVSKSVGGKGDLWCFWYRSSKSMVVFDWQGTTSY